MQSQVPDFKKILQLEDCNTNESDCVLLFIEKLTDRYWTSFNNENYISRSILFYGDPNKFDFTFDYVKVDCDCIPNSPIYLTPIEAEEFFFKK